MPPAGVINNGTKFRLVILGAVHRLQVGYYPLGHRLERRVNIPQQRFLQLDICHDGYRYDRRQKPDRILTGST